MAEAAFLIFSGFLTQLLLTSTIKRLHRTLIGRMNHSVLCARAAFTIETVLSKLLQTEDVYEAFLHTIKLHNCSVYIPLNSLIIVPFIIQFGAISE